MPVWLDEEDEEVKVDLNERNRLRKLKKDNNNIVSGKELQERLQKQFEETKGSEAYKWAFDAEENENELDKVLRSRISHKLKDDPKQLKLRQLLSTEVGHASVISDVGFCKGNLNISYSVGLDRKFKIIQLDKNESKLKLIKSVYLEDMPIFAAKPIGENEILLSGRQKHFYTYNLVSHELKRHILNKQAELVSLEHAYGGTKYFAFGSFEGKIAVYSSRKKTFIRMLQVSGSVTGVDFFEDYLFCSTDYGDIYIFDSRKEFDCIGKIDDSGNYKTTCLRVSSDGLWLATGSETGEVNLYSLDKVLRGGNVEPEETLKNLTTCVTKIAFGGENKYMAFASKWDKHALRVFNLEEKKVAVNFPSYTDRLKVVMTVEFNDDGSAVMIGNDEGKVFCYELL